MADLDLPALRELARKATPGPWTNNLETIAGRVWVEGPRHDAHFVAAPLFEMRGGEPGRVEANIQRAADAAFIAAARNHWDALLDRLEAAEARFGHAGWVGGMVLGICEGAPGWESVKECPPGPEVEAWGGPSIVAAKSLMRRALAAEAERDAALAEVERLRSEVDAARARALEEAAVVFLQAPDVRMSGSTVAATLRAFAGPAAPPLATDATKEPTP